MQRSKTCEVTQVYHAGAVSAWKRWCSTVQACNTDGRGDRRDFCCAGKRANGAVAQPHVSLPGRSRRIDVGSCFAKTMQHSSVGADLNNNDGARDKTRKICRQDSLMAKRPANDGTRNGGGRGDQRSQSNEAQAQRGKKSALHRHPTSIFRETLRRCSVGAAIKYVHCNQHTNSLLHRMADMNAEIIKLVR